MAKEKKGKETRAQYLVRTKYENKSTRGLNYEHKMERYIAQARKLAELRMDDYDIMDVLELEPSTFYRWRKNNPEFRKALTQPWAELRIQIRNKMIKKALVDGNQQALTKIFDTYCPEAKNQNLGMSIEQLLGNDENPSADDQGDDSNQSDEEMSFEDYINKMKKIDGETIEMEKERENDGNADKDSAKKTYRSIQIQK